MHIIPDWRDKNLRCHYCDETRSVKYAMTVLNNKPTLVYVCNKCALRMRINKVDNYVEGQG